MHFDSNTELGLTTSVSFSLIITILKSEIFIVKQLQHLPFIWRNGPLRQILSKVETEPQNHLRSCVMLTNSLDLRKLLPLLNIRNTLTH